MVRIIACRILFCVFAPMALANPATQPDTKPAIDLSTPKGALRAFAAATRAADFEALQRVSPSNPGDDLEGKFIVAANNYQRAMGGLFAAVRDKFGDAEVRKFTRQRGAVPLEPFLRLIEVELDQHEVAIDGDKAKLIDKQQPTTDIGIRLIRENGQWKVASTGLLLQFGEEPVRQRIEMLALRAAIVDEVTAEVAQDKYENIEAVGNGLRDALRRR